MKARGQNAAVTTQSKRGPEETSDRHGHCFIRSFSQLIDWLIDWLSWAFSSGVNLRQDRCFFLSMGVGFARNPFLNKLPLSIVLKFSRVISFIKDFHFVRFSFEGKISFQLPLLPPAVPYPYSLSTSCRQANYLTTWMQKQRCYAPLLPLWLLLLVSPRIEGEVMSPEGEDIVDWAWSEWLFMRRRHHVIE